PYTSVWAVHQTLDVLRKIFPYLTCDREITGHDERACLYFDIKLCNGPCVGAASQAEYRLMIQDFMNFLGGHTEEIVDRLHVEMREAAEALNFERAAAKRDQLRAIDNVVKRQKVVFASDYADSDVIAMARADKEACVQVFFIRGGKLIGREYFLLEGPEDTPDAEVMTGFLQQFYDQSPTVPEQVLLPHEIEEAGVIHQWLKTKRGGEKVELLIPREGQQHDLVLMAAENASDTLNSLRAQWEADKHKQTLALAELQEALKMSVPPNRIECFDISNTQGVASVGSMVVFERGVPDKQKYRKFNIKTVIGPDDFSSMEEVLTRRFNRWQVQEEEKAKRPGQKVDPSFGFLPDLLIVDGGKGQLGRAVDVLERFGLTGKFKVVGLAKREEEIFTPGNPVPVMLPRNSQGLFLVQRIRDEAHRFAITAHRNRRDKMGIASQLDSVPGIGPAKRKALLSHFGDLDEIRAASLEALQTVPGITEKIAQSIKSHLA
ncbi:MAG: excinuclease ABC subunit UvrC, partial [Anaerolineales bacterium]|nr:excinuclease ABC subunit UvrC [Anaerolineales bacterium]